MFELQIDQFDIEFEGPGDGAGEAGPV